MKHHYVPQCYLKGFVGKSNKLFKRPLDTPFIPAIREFTTAQVAYDTDFYRLDTGGDAKGISGDPYVLEKKFNQQFENSFESQLQMLIRRFSFPSFAERFSFAETILHLKRRNMYFREKVYSESNSTEIAKSTLEKIARENRDTLKRVSELEGSTIDEVIDITKKILDELISSKDYGKNMHNFSLFKRGADSPIIARVCNYIAVADWTILKTSAIKPFVTSDNPGFLIDATGSIKNMGFEGAFRYYLPLNTENTLLVARNSASTFGSFKTEWAKGILVDIINTGTLLMANKQIFGPSRQSLIEINSSALMLECLRHFGWWPASKIRDNVR